MNFTNRFYQLIKYFAFALLMGLTFYGCPPEITYPDKPHLEFKSLTIGYGVTGDSLKIFTLIASFTDGDGDIGYHLDRPNEPIFDDITSKYYYNFVLELQVQRNGIWKDTSITYANDSTVVFYNDLASARIPYLTQESKNKGLKGDIDKTAYLPILLGDTIRFRAFIYDRALNKSNEIYTPGYYVKNP